MGLISYKPTSSGQRRKISITFEEVKNDELSRKRKERKKTAKGLLTRVTRTAGRNNMGRITSRFRGGGHRKIYRQIDFIRRDKADIPAYVDFIDYDPNRTCFIALINYADGEKRFILAPKGVKAGDQIISGATAPIRDGNAMPLVNIPLGSSVHNTELIAGRGGKLVRSAGQSAQVLAKENGMVAIKLPSGESRWIDENCYATLGTLSNTDHSNRVIGKAGAVRWKGKKPHVRGSAMNPNDHKHGGGEGKSPIGAASPYTAFGKPHGRKTRSKRKNSSKHIINTRKK